MSELPQVVSMHPQSGRFFDESNNTVNIADCFATNPNGDQSIAATAGSIVTLTPPDGSVKAIITNPSDVWIRFGGPPELNVGTLYPDGQGVVLESSAELSANIFVVSDCTLFVQYFK